MSRSRWRRALDRFSKADHTRGRGAVGEEVAVAWLEANGYRIEGTNVVTPSGEIDVLAWDGEFLCVVEVKARASRRYGRAIEAVDWNKQRRLLRAGTWLLGRYDAPLRFDVLALDRNEDGEWEATLVPNAIQADEGLTPR